MTYLIHDLINKHLMIHEITYNSILIVSLDGEQYVASLNIA